MFDNPSLSINQSTATYPICDSSLPFADYIARSRAFIEEKRLFPEHIAGIEATHIINTNAPYELRPSAPVTTGKRITHGALLIHGLLDCPFSLRDIGEHLQKNGVLSRAVLLPGHGTRPADLSQVSYHDWIQTVRYGIETLKQEVDHIVLIGYSTGAALSIYQALQDTQIAGIVLLAPAIRIKSPVNLVLAWHHLTKRFNKNHTQWIYRGEENDDAKYHSIALNAVSQVAQLTDVIADLNEQHALKTPVYMIMSNDDETISSRKAIGFFNTLPNEKNKLLLYSPQHKVSKDPRIVIRNACYPDLRIEHFSHVSVPFSPTNPHYGQQGDYVNASRLDAKQFKFGAYNHLQESIWNQLYQLGLTQHKRHELTYNPDFAFMADEITQFICG